MAMESSLCEDNMGPAMQLLDGPAVAEESRVLIIMTGGTICMQDSGDGLAPMTGFLEKAMAPRPSFNDSSARVPLYAFKDGARHHLDSLRTPLSAYCRHIRYGVLEFAPLLDSSSISAKGWTEIALTVRENYHLFDGFVILHGTDSLAYTSSALSFMMSDLGKPVVLTGSQASIFALQSDATDNLLGSLIVAGTFIVPEVCLLFHHKLFRGNRTTKVSALSFEAFDSPNCEPLATVTSLGINVNWSLVRRPTAIAEFSVTTLDTAHVACVRIFPGIKPEMLDSVLRVPDLRGLILETFGMGNAPRGVDGSLTGVIREAVKRGTVVVNVSQCANGFVSPLYAAGTALGRAGTVSGNDLTSEAALTKLMYLLALPGLSRADINARMALSLRGEMTELRRPMFAHPESNPDTAATISKMLSPAEAVFATLGHAIRRGDLKLVRELLDRDKPADQHRDGQLLTRADYAGNTAVHLAATIKFKSKSASILRELLIRGASVHTRNAANSTPLWLAERTGNDECVALLKEAGAHLWETEEASNSKRKRRS